MKYYAVKNGRVPGIYNSWAECQKQIHGFKNASYKSFTSRKEAEEFISDKKETPQMEHGLMDSRSLNVFMDMEIMKNVYLVVMSQEKYLGHLQL